MANYVKFRRGTIEAYQRLTHYDDDTLYFVYETDASDGILYLGSKLIAGGEISDFSISSLKDIVISNVGDKQILVYNEELEAWTNISYSELIEEFVGATESSAGVAGLVPAPPEGRTDLFLRSDGRWGEINVSSSGDCNILDYVNNLKAPHEEVIDDITNGLNLFEGDILIIKDILHENKYKHTAYVYDGAEWLPMDGNYSAENVYFTEDFIFTENIGTVEIPESGSTVVPAAGLNLKEFFASIFAEEKNPEIESPSASITLSPATTSYEVGTLYTPKYKITFNPGSYEFGPETGVSASYEVTDTNGGTSSEIIGSFEAFTIEDDTNYKISAIVSHSSGATPLTNLGKAFEAGKIEEGTLDKINTSVVKGYRNCFYGSLTEKTELTSDIVRNLNKTGYGVKAGSTFNISIPVGTKRVVFAYPDSVREVSSVTDSNGMHAEIATSFEQLTMQVKGCNDYESIEYKVYILDYANGATEANSYKVTI